MTAVHKTKWFLWEWAHGRSGSPYTQLGALAVVACVASLGLLRWRS